MNETERQRRIRERAYHIWIEEGRPDGREAIHWEMACELVAQEENVAVATKPNPVRRRRAGAASGTPPGARRDEPVEPPEALANQGPFPGLRDQGDESPRPPSRKAPRRR